MHKKVCEIGYILISLIVHHNSTLLLWQLHRQSLKFNYIELHAWFIYRNGWWKKFQNGLLELKRHKIPGLWKNPKWSGFKNIRKNESIFIMKLLLLGFMAGFLMLGFHLGGCRWVFIHGFLLGGLTMDIYLGWLIGGFFIDGFLFGRFFCWVSITKFYS